MGIVAQPESGRSRVIELCEDALVLENLDLRVDLRAVQELLSLSLTQLHEALEREKRLARRVRSLMTAAQSVQGQRAA